MSRHTVLLFALATLSAAAVPSFAQNAYPAGPANDNYTQSQAAPIERTAPSSNSSARLNHAYPGQSANANQYSGDSNQTDTNNGQPADANGQPGPADGAGPGYAGGPYVANGYPYPAYGYGYGYPYGYYAYPYGYYPYGFGFGFGYGYRGGYGGGGHR